MDRARPTRKPRVAVVFGGRSSEHAHLVRDGRQRAAAPSTRERTTSCPSASPPTAAGCSSPATRSGSRSPARDKLPEVDAGRAPVALASDAAASELVVHEPSAVPRTLGEVDVVFPLLHGPWGEDGTIQGLLEMAGVRYVGAGVLASAVGMDKHYMKLVLQAHGLPVLPYAVLTARAWAATTRAPATESVDALGYPVFVKPCRGGSSIGISKVHDAAELAAAVEEAQRHDPKVLVEAAAEGAREVECGVLAGLRRRGAPDASVVAEIRVDPAHEFYDFAAKYLPEEHTALDVPADLPDEVAARVRSWPCRRSRRCRARGWPGWTSSCSPTSGWWSTRSTRCPGFTPSSMFPRMWAASGLDYPALVDRLVQLALQRDTGLR